MRAHDAFSDACGPAPARVSAQYLDPPFASGAVKICPLTFMCVCEGQGVGRGRGIPKPRFQRRRINCKIEISASTIIILLYCRMVARYIHARRRGSSRFKKYMYIRIICICEHFATPSRTHWTSESTALDIIYIYFTSSEPNCWQPPPRRRKTPSYTQQLHTHVYT